VTNSPINAVKQLRLKYPGDDKLLFRDLSLEIRRGEKVLLLGPSGCGKSTLLQVLSGLVPSALALPMKCEERVVPQRWGCVFQDPDTQFCMPYADEELAFALENLQVVPSEMPALIRYYMDLVGLRFEDTHVPIASFSQGMKQRLAIASAMALEPEVLYLDEPTALLDPEGTEQMWDTLLSLPREPTMLIVEHKIDRALQIVDRVISFNGSGEVVADQSPERFLAADRGTLHASGIWYPGIWTDYDAQRTAAAWTRPLPPSPVRPVLELRDFAGYRGRQPVIRVPEATVWQGEWVSVMGRNGAGKSSLLLAIMRLIRSEGDCLLEGCECAKTSRAAERTGFVFQNPELQFLTNSALDELTFSLRQSSLAPEACRRQARELLSRFGLDGCEDRHPYQLSMGQKRRLSVATAVGCGKPLLLLDEPTFGLDARSAIGTLELLEELRREGAAILMVTHDPDIASRFSTRIWTIEDGALKEDAPC